MPTQSTYASPGYSGPRWTLGAGLITLGVHTQMTFVAPTDTKMLWTCRQAATKSAAVVFCRPQGYQLPFISCASVIATGRFSVRTSRANALTYSSLSPAAILAIGTFVGSQLISGRAPYWYARRTPDASKPSMKPS